MHIVLFTFTKLIEFGLRFEDWGIIVFGPLSQYGTRHCTATERERGRVSSVYCTIGEYRVESGRRAEHASCHSPTGRLLFAVSREVEVVSQASARLNTPRTGKV